MFTLYILQARNYPEIVCYLTGGNEIGHIVKIQVRAALLYLRIEHPAIHHSIVTKEDQLVLQG